ncbi:carboxylate-amine ligase [Pseudomonas sp. ZM23]|uniref:Putative glutamate--cysteine ligase 2 n=1 Tax=Pseudomonas triclosanedens TaxID=2961893 RepID=A0ABY7A8D3_9PSED|nr:carboxylate-amine ligase [Pseudomonas triclosanedens]MCP8467586.1 carboxylate-amine ligase [Pseudomonas triclosanedens]MCP8471763.1 carboxylate-amine ligase [Pseudomonas triclosanedens]MCP8478884.1 carboxylate-amine ligase [Pseudomonas triclosanedens]WAI52368.1 carboxylate-amine ligase [Pseudomonas triclosanedens]
MPALARFGIEEECFLLDRSTLDIVRDVPLGFLHACRGVLGEEVIGEIFDCQIELVSPVFRQLADAGRYLADRRRRLAAIAQAHELETLCVAAHPFTRLHRQRPAVRPRYQRLIAQQAGVAGESLLCGLHVHVEVKGFDRVQLMNRLLPWLPLLLALSGSSPFWGGRDTGLASHRQAMCGEWPRMGPPPHFHDESQWRRYVALLLEHRLMDEAGHTWWIIRPSARYPTLELRIPDACPRIDDALCIAGLFRLLVAQARWGEDIAAPEWQRALLLENLWQARRHGCTGSFLVERNRCVSALDWLRLAEKTCAGQADAGSRRIFMQARRIIKQGNSADRQLRVYRAARNAGAGSAKALRCVVEHLLAENRRPPGDTD